MYARTPAPDYSILPEPYAQLAQKVEAQMDIDADLAVRMALSLQQAAYRSGGTLLMACADLALGRSQLAAGQSETASPHLHSARKRFEQAGRTGHAVLALLYLGAANLQTSSYETAALYLHDALTLLRRAPHGTHEPLLTATLNLLAKADFERGRPAEALKHLQAALPLLTPDEHEQRVIIQTNTGLVYTRMGEPDKAIHWLSGAYQHLQAGPRDPKLETNILLNLAYLHHLVGNGALALEVMRSAYPLATGSGDPWQTAYAELNLGTYCTEAGAFSEAEEHLLAALNGGRTLGSLQIELNALDSLGTLHERQGHLERALNLYREALFLALASDSRIDEINARLNTGRLTHQLGNSELAREDLLQALDLARAAGTPHSEAAAHQALCALEVSEGHWQQAYQHQARLLHLNTDLFNQERDRKLQNLAVEFEVERARRDAEQSRQDVALEVAARETAERQVSDRTAELAQAQREIVSRLALAAEYRDTVTGDHIRRVGHLSAQIARALQWDAERARTLGLAARLHDVGKIGLPDSILLKPGRLTHEEFAQMQAHTTIGAQILSQGQSELVTLAEVIAMNHHERWDGQGYPQGLRGEDIPLPARIVAVADVFDALVQQRPYKPAWSREAAMAELEQQAGRHFDPHLVTVALTLLRSGTDPMIDPHDEPLPPHASATRRPDPTLERQLQERTLELEEVRSRAEHLLNLAFTDPLTSLNNRRAFELDLEHHLSSLADLAFTVISYDLDGLKQVNDQSGHQTGDQLLITFAESLKRTTDHLGRAYRIGGDEFAVIAWEHLTEPTAREVALAMETHLHEQGFPTAGASYGLAHYPQDARSAGDLLRTSDQRMYDMKLGRRHHVTD